MTFHALIEKNQDGLWVGVISLLEHDVQVTGKTEEECKNNLRRALYDDMHKFYADRLAQAEQQGDIEREQKLHANEARDAKDLKTAEIETEKVEA